MILTPTRLCELNTDFLSALPQKQCEQLFWILAGIPDDAAVLIIQQNDSSYRLKTGTELSSDSPFVIRITEDLNVRLEKKTEITTQTKINAETGAVAKGALFNMECVPAETLFSAPIQLIGRYKNTDADAELSKLVGACPVLQFGGNSTTGRGFCSISLK